MYNIVDLCFLFQSTRSILTTKHIELIQQWKIENGGSIANFDDLAKIDGIDKKIIENLREFCVSKMANDAQNLDNHTTAIEHAEFVPGPDYIPNDMYSNDFIKNDNNFIRIPPIDAMASNSKSGGPIKLVLEPKFDWEKTIISFTTIHQQANGISIARFSANHLKWNDIKIDPWTHYKTKTFSVKNLSRVCQQLAVIVEQLPQSNIYIVDDYIKAQRYRKPVAPKKLAEIIQINQQCAILLALLHRKVSFIDSDIVESNIHFMGYQAAGQLFNLLVGNEPISNQSTIRNLLGGNFSVETLQLFKSFKIDVSDKIKRAFYESNAVEREYMGRSMLMGLTFIRYMILEARKLSSEKM